jgi:hypothetical protein
MLRYFLAKLNNEDIQSPKVGDTLVKLSYLTRFMSLVELIKTYNEALSAEEKPFEVDSGMVHIRDAIAHGRLVTTAELPFRLWKFGDHKGANVEIAFSEELTSDWLKKTSAAIEAEKQKVVDCFKARGFQGLR